MPLSKWQIKPGFDKQNSEVGAVARYVGGDNVRFRYSLPEKVGGWKAEGGESISSVSRRLHPFRGNDGNKYLAIGTDKFLLIYYEDNFYDITPYRSSGFPLTIDEFKNSTFSFTSGSNVVEITTQSINGLSAGDIVEFNNVTLPTTTVASTTLQQYIIPEQTSLPLTSTAGFLPANPVRIVDTGEQLSFTGTFTNHLAYTEEFDNAWWGKARTNVTANTEVAPDGTTTAETIQQDLAATSSGAVFRNSLTGLTPGVNTFSVFAKYKPGSNISHIYLQDFSMTGGGVLNKTYFDIQNGTVGTTDPQHTATITNVGNGWYRCSTTFTTVGTGGNLAIYRSDADNGGTATLGDEYYMWGANFGPGTVSDYAVNRTTTTPVTSLIGLTRGINGTAVQPANSGATVESFTTVGFNDDDFEDKLYEVKSIVSDTEFTVEQTTNASQTLSGGSATVTPLETIGNQIQQFTFGWGTGVWGGANNWGEAATTNGVNTPPGLWSLSNFGQVLVATILNGKTFTWNPAAGNPLGQRASVLTTGFETDLNPTNTRISMVSPTTRHLIHMGTETTVGVPSTQDDMFVRFSSQEQINTYDITAGNSAGSQRIQDGTKIVGAIKSKEAILIWTDNALYLMRHIGQPFVFGFEQVGTNCGLLGQNAVVEVDGVAYWMSDKGFFKYDGSVKTLDCSVEDYVYDDVDLTQSQQIYAGVNNLYTEVRWDYPSSSADYNDRYVIFNFAEGVWYTGNTPRTSWADSNVFSKPFATDFDNTTNGDFPEVIGEPAAPNGYGKTILYNHEIGVDQENLNGSITRITSNLESFDFDISNPQIGDGEVFLSMRRFIPDFKTLVGTARVTLTLKRYPSDTGTTSTYSSFDVTSTTEKKDTRARGRFLSIKIENPGAEDGENWRYGTLRIDIQPDGRR